MITRTEYMNKQASHHDFYIQFATRETFDVVKRFIGVDAIKSSKDEHFNDISLSKWDALNGGIRASINQRLKGRSEGFPVGKFGWSPADAVCIAKAVAQEIRDDVPPMTPSMETMKRAMNGNEWAQRVMYLDYVNDFLTVQGFADYYGVSARSAEVYINDWREVQERHAQLMSG